MTVQQQINVLKGTTGKLHGWHRHPGVRSPHQLTLGERSADKMRNGMGSWAFVFGSLAFLAAWMLFNGRHGFDAYPFILLNLILSCLAAMQGAILLIAAKRSDQISSELAQHDYETDVQAKELLERLTANFEILTAQHQALHQEISKVHAKLAGQDAEEFPPLPR
ncbi:putative membrane protein [Kitasatospora sp. MAP12-15]|uniref:DUF1003 domain-containing protein n=1 Tax=unclassified Kitasatospora TaxID=2633591 RepID=UPI002475C74D|nr:DUF1003 domain-containing protein [Kitasatospora sp. MAP12-44]MDH6113834.1 putative membrane protein [Kitasatospora sp. MAP12-44]